MAELGKTLGKLSLAILENFVEGTLGKKFVDELRAPTDRALTIEAALENTEKRFTKEFDDKVFAEKIFTQVGDQYIGLLSEVVGKFFDHPTESDFQKTLTRIVRDSFPYIDAARVDRAMQQYVTILTEECALADDTFREKVRGLADLHGERSQQEMVEILRRVEALLAQRGIPHVIPLAFRSLHQLPQPPADFTGREELIAQLLADFQRGKGATITGLIGMGGIGKTSLGLVVAHEVSKNYPDAQIFLDLKGTTEPLSAVDVMRHVILSFEPAIDLRTLDEISMANAYRSVLHGKRVLLFLDNARSAEQIAPLRPPETCAMLVTSRWTFSVPGLHTRRLDVMSEENAITFLLELCPRVREKADELAKACGYLPLALRIIGSFLEVNGDWSVDQCLAQLNNRKQRLATLRQRRAEAELTTEPDLLATFELSYNVLPEEDRQRWRKLGVFPTSFDLNAAVAMWELDEGKTRKLLGLLLRYSLLDYDETSSRYSLHELLADYALSQMNDEEEREAHLNHASHYMNVLKRADNLYLEGSENVLAGLRLFVLEWENIRRGQTWVASGGNNPVILALCIAYPDAGAHILSLRQHPREQIRWLKASISAAQEIGDRQGEGVSLGNLGLAYYGLGEISNAIEFFEQALVIARQTADRRNEGNWLGDLGIAHAGFGKTHKAIEYYEQALVVARQVADRRSEGNWLGNLGIAYYSLGEISEAIKFYEQALAIHTEIGDQYGESTAFGNLGSAYYSLGKTRKAIKFHERHLTIAREIGDRYGEGNALYNIGVALYDLEEKARAIHLVRQALETYETMESPNAERARKKLKEWGAGE